MRAEPLPPDLSQLGAFQIVPYSQGGPGADPEPTGASVPASHYVWVLRRHV